VSPQCLVSICYARPMGALHRSPRIRFKGTRSRQGKYGVLALEGAAVATLRAANAWAVSNAGSVFRVAVDGGLRSWRALGRACDLYVGDGDSAPPPEDTEAIVYSPAKSFSDLSGALTEMRRRHISVVCIAGVTGGRLDHEWVNLLELASQAKHFAGLLAPSPRGWVAVTSCGAAIETVKARTFSLIAPAGRTRVTLRGARWTLADEWVGPGSHGLSNVTTRNLRLTVHSGVAAMIFPDS
jgi:thiamine pyrophosphokinase